MTSSPASRILPITKIAVGSLPPRVLVVGDPGRAERAAERLEGSRLLASNREYLSFVGSVRGEAVGVVSHGVGAAGAAACFEELVRAGARRIVRAGTAGGLLPDVREGDLVVASAAVRDDGTSDGLVPRAFPAAATPELTIALRRAAARRCERARTGIVLTSSVFYAHDVLGSNLALWARAGCLAVEMETSVLFVIAALRGVEAAAILAIDGNPLATGDEAMDGYDPHRAVVLGAVDMMIDAAIDALLA